MSCSLCPPLSNPHPISSREPEPLRKEFAGQKTECFEVTAFKHTDEMSLEVLRREEEIEVLSSEEKEEVPLPPTPSTLERS